MGRVRTKTTKKAAKVLIEKYYNKLTNDFHFNKKILSEVALVPSKRMRNKIAGFATHLMKRIQKGPVRGISLKVQEEERERRLDYVPEKSKIDISRVVVSSEIRDMLKKVGMDKMPGLVSESGRPQKGEHKKRGRGKPHHHKDQH
mmetsp:Transcript_5035/g.4229  ORF Transcript_5035/g.4229 Transcript_5035/m.4229 type:complete len:145 (-) Transcript_5035:541-975(-)